MFQFRGLASLRMTGLLPAGLSHSEISGSILVCKSPELFAAYHVFLRLQEPRHPPYALIYFLTTPMTTYCLSSDLFLIPLNLVNELRKLSSASNSIAVSLCYTLRDAVVTFFEDKSSNTFETKLQKGGVPAAPSGTATLLRLSPSHRFCPRSILAVTNFRHPRLSWLDGRCVQGPGTYSPRHG